MSKPPVPPGQDPGFIPPGQGGTPPGQAACFVAGTRIAVPAKPDGVTEHEDFCARLFGFGVAHIWRSRPDDRC